MSSQSSKSPIPSQRPKYSFKDLIMMAINSSHQQAMLLNDIIVWISENFPYYRRDRRNWQKQVRDNLSSCDCFVGLKCPVNLPGRGKLWVVAPKGYKPGDPIGAPHAEFVGGAMRCDFPSANPQAGVPEEGMVDYPMQPRINSYFETRPSVLSITNSDGSITSQSSTSSVPIEKPKYTYEELITMAISSSPQKALPLSDIIDWISRNFHYYRKDMKYWQKSVRCTLTNYKCFLGMSRTGAGKGKKLFWTVVTATYHPDDTTPKDHNKFQAEAMPPDVLQVKMSSRFEPKRLDYNTTNSDGSKIHQNSNSPTPIQRPNYTYEELITMAISNRAEQKLPACDIIDWISRNYPYYRKDVQDWQDQVGEILRQKFNEFDLLSEDPRLGDFWAVPPTLEELSRLQASREAVVEGTAMATEPTTEGDLHHQPESVFYQQQQDEL